jgi:hypothetical protein
VPSELAGSNQTPPPERWTSIRVPAWTVTVRPLSLSVSTTVPRGTGQGAGRGAILPAGLATGVTSQGGGGQGRVAPPEDGDIPAALQGIVTGLAAARAGPLTTVSPPATATAAARVASRLRRRCARFASLIDPSPSVQQAAPVAPAVSLCSPTRAGGAERLREGM